MINFQVNHYSQMIPHGKRRQAIDQALTNKWAQAAHLLFLDSFMQESKWKSDELAFHGGTSLHLSWRSPRYSEDLDFLLSRTAKGAAQVVNNATKRVQARFRAIDPDFTVQVKDRTKDEDRMQVFNITVSHPRIVGNAMIKVEFWKTDPAYLQNYPTEFKTPVAAGDLAGTISYPVPAASLATAYADKLVAFATRPQLKWRDIFDLWWIGTQSNAQIDRNQMYTQFLQNIQAYTPLKGLSPHKALLEFLQHDRQQVINKADPDLRNWLPDALWKVLHPTGVIQMVDYVRSELQSVHDAIEYQIASQAQDVPTDKAIAEIPKG